MKPNTVEIKLNIDASILVSMKEKKDQFTKALLFYSALGLYKTGKLSLGKAAALCNTQRLEFIEKIQAEGVAIFDYENELIDDMISGEGKKRTGQNGTNLRLINSKQKW